MTNFAVQTSLGAMAPIVSKDKGSMGNRLDCAGAHMKNNLISAAQLGVVYGATTGVGYGVYKSPKFASAITKGLKQVQNLMMKHKFTSKIASLIQNALKGLPTKSKIGIGIAGIALPLIGYITHKHSYKAGQIDQQYTDKAKFQKTL